ncbi:MAG TPA: helix-turn-helix domain-containing protein [Flavobacterium sp.]|jgi:DNA-binding HxlR family transcriptional regulator|nr:helix-turn-helix domain-containing protein [Flavobacterium sp.]
MPVKKGYNNCISTIKPVRDFLDVMSGKWKFPILVSIGVGNDRFTDIQESIPGITPKVLAKELKELETHQLIKRTVIEDYPVKITYTRQPYADSLTPVIYAMKEWGINHRKQVFGEAEIEEVKTDM